MIRIYDLFMIFLRWGERGTMNILLFAGLRGVLNPICLVGGGREGRNHK